MLGGAARIDFLGQSQKCLLEQILGGPFVPCRTTQEAVELGVVRLERSRDGAIRMQSGRRIEPVEVGEVGPDWIRHR